MAASESSFRAAASADPAISRDGIGASVSHNISGRSSGTDEARRRNLANHSTYESAYLSARDTPAFTGTSDVAKWRADPTRIWSAPSSYGNLRPGPSNIQNSPSPPDVYRHNSSNAFPRGAVSSRFETRPLVAGDMRAGPAPPLSAFAESPPLNPYAAYNTQSDGRPPHTYGSDERAYWSGFEDGVQYERQREAFLHRSGEFSEIAFRRCMLTSDACRCICKAKTCR